MRSSCGRHAHSPAPTSVMHAVAQLIADDLTAILTCCTAVGVGAKTVELPFETRRPFLPNRLDLLREGAVGFVSRAAAGIIERGRVLDGERGELDVEHAPELALERVNRGAGLVRGHVLALSGGRSPKSRA